MTADFKAYQERVTASLVNVTRSAANVASHDLSFHRSLSDKVSRSLDTQNAHLLRLTSKLLKAATKDTNIKAPNLKDQDSMDDNWRGIIDVVDDLLEKADASLDEFTGVIKRMSPSVPGTPEPAPKPRFSSSTYSVAYGITKPQLSFHRKVDNYETGAWKPLLTTKPHALVPLEDSIGTDDKGQVMYLGHGFCTNPAPDTNIPTLTKFKTWSILRLYALMPLPYLLPVQKDQNRFGWTQRQAFRKCWRN